jgi:hypothetical protein
VGCEAQEGKKLARAESGSVVDTVDRPSETVIDSVEVVRRPVLNLHALNEVAL